MAKTSQLPAIYTSEQRMFGPSQIDILLGHHRKDGGRVLFLEEMHWWSSKLKWWTRDTTAAIFWQEKIPTNIPEATNWFGYYWTPQETKLMVFGLPADYDPVISALLVHPSNTIIYSRYQHDFFYDPSGKVGVDGGMEYGRILGNREDFTDVKLNLVTKQYCRPDINDKVWYDTASAKK